MVTQPHLLAADNQSVELLVHVTAPTSNLDDNRYRSQATGVLSFVSTNKLFVGIVSWPRNNVSLIIMEGAFEQLHFQYQWGGSKRIMVDGFNEISHKPRAPKFSKFLCPDKQPMTNNDQAPPKAPVSTRLGVETLERNRLSTKVLAYTVPASSISSTGRSINQPTPKGESQITNYEFPSELPQSLCSSIPDSEPLRTILDFTNIYHSQKSEILFPALSAGPLLQISTPAPRLESFELPQYFTPTSPSQATIKHLHSASQLQVGVPPFSPLTPLPTLVRGPYTISSPHPGTLTNPPQVPEMICKVIEDPNKGLFDRYEKSVKLKKRNLRQWERGYWRMDLSGWGDQKKKIFFWNNVVDNVVQGRWGMVNVSLGTEESPERFEYEDIGHMNPQLKSEFERKGNLVKIYCWGGAAKYIWAALYTFSWKQMEGAEWVDARGKTVITCA